MLVWGEGGGLALGKGGGDEGAFVGVAGESAGTIEQCFGDSWGSGRVCRHGEESDREEERKRLTRDRKRQTRDRKRERQKETEKRERQKETERDEGGKKV